MVFQLRIGNPRPLDQKSGLYLIKKQQKRRTGLVFPWHGLSRKICVAMD